MTTSELIAGDRVGGRYVIARELGRGGSKRVYLARDTLGAVDVAIALLAPEYARDPMLSARFSREARAASVLRSPFVVHVYDVGKLEDQTRYLVLEAVQGRDMATALDRGAVDPPTAVRWTLEVLAALCEAHARGIVHRDIKPENILLAPSEHGELAKVTDFGLAKVADRALEGSIHLRTAANAALGTPEYMSPEQWRGEPVDARTDVYSVGILLFELLMGRLPFGGDNVAAIYAGHFFAPVPTMVHANPMVQRIEPIVRRALAKRADERFESALAMAQALAEATGVRVPPEAFAHAAPAWSPRTLRGELLCDRLPQTLALLVSSTVILGSDRSAGICTRFLPPNDANRARERSVAPQHALLDWRGGQARLCDLGANATRVDGHEVTREPVALRSSALIALGPHCKLRFVHGPSERGALPQWATLTRTDPEGRGLCTLLLLGGRALVGLDPSSAIVADLPYQIGLEVIGDAVVLTIDDVAYTVHDERTLCVAGDMLSVVIAR